MPSCIWIQKMFSFSQNVLYFTPAVLFFFWTLVFATPDDDDASPNCINLMIIGNLARHQLVCQKRLG